MNSLLLKEIIEEILDKEGITLSDFAIKTKANRTHLSKIRNSKVELPITDNLINKIKKNYPLYFKDNQQNRQDRIDEIIANLKEIRALSMAILTEQEAGQLVVLGSLERLEGKPAGALSGIADTLAKNYQKKIRELQKGM